MPGIDSASGKLISGWPEVEQSIGTILSTAIGERVFRRDFGAEEAGYQDKPTNEPTLVGTYAAIAAALEPRVVRGRQMGEPRFDLVRIVPTAGGASGRIELEMIGLYYPRGHLGDFSVVEARGFVFR